LSCTPLPSKWQTIRTTAKIAQSKDKIEEYMKRLEDLRNALSFHIVVSLKRANQEQSASTDKKLAALQEDVSTIVHMFENRSGDMQQIAAQHSDVVEWCVDLSSVVARPNDITDQDDEEFSQEFEGLLGRRNGNLSSLNFTPQRLAMMRKREAILDLLQFRQIDDRFYEIDQAYKETFGWIFEPPATAESLPWDDFSPQEQTKRQRAASPQDSSDEDFVKAWIVASAKKDKFYECGDRVTEDVNFKSCNDVTAPGHKVNVNQVDSNRANLAYHRRSSRS
jgi:hypothetical protein